MPGERTSLSIKKKIRDELRRYKAQDGLTYDEAIARLLAEVEWIDDESEIIQDGQSSEEHQ